MSLLKKGIIKICIIIMFLLLSISMIKEKSYAAEKKYTITYNAKEGVDAPKVQIKVKDKSIRLSKKIPKRTGYKFLGWSINSKSEKVNYKPGGLYSKNSSLKLFAVWKPNIYKIKYNSNGGSTEPACQLKTHGKNLKLTTYIPKRRGYIFKGWSKLKNSLFAKYKPGSTFCENEDTKLYAVWKKGSYEVIYYANGGRGGVKKQIKKYNKELVLSKNIPFRSGYTFLGWGNSSNSTNISYYPGDKYKYNMSKKLYALWGKTKRKTYNESHAMVAVGSGVGVVEANCVYSEDYKKNGNNIFFYKHRTYLTLNLSTLNDEEEFTIYPPQVITHKDSSNRKLNSFIVNKREDVLECADYFFSYSNRKKVTYKKDKKVKGSCGFLVKYGPYIWSPNSVEMDISGNSLKKFNESKKEKVEYSYLLGKIEKNYIKNDKSNMQNLLINKKQKNIDNLEKRI